MTRRVEQLLERVVNRLDRLIVAVERLEPPVELRRPDSQTAAPANGRRLGRVGRPWKARPHHRAFHRLSDQARLRVHAGFQAGESTVALAATLASTFKETIAVSSLNRYRDYWEATNGVRARPRSGGASAEKNSDSLAVDKSSRPTA